MRPFTGCARSTVVFATLFLILTATSCSHRSSQDPGWNSPEARAELVTDVLEPTGSLAGPDTETTDDLNRQLDALLVSESMATRAPPAASSLRRIKSAPHRERTSSFGMQEEEASAEEKRAAADEEAKPMISITRLQPILTPVSDYTGTFTDRTTLTGDWGGPRQELFDSGFALDVALTQTFQTVVSGGEKTGGTGYNALVDYGVTLDTGKLGLWPGGVLIVNAQSAFASGLPVGVGSASPSDYTELFPTFERPKTALMEYYFIQGLSETLGVMFGRVDPVRWDLNRFAFDPRNQFMNAAMDQQLLVGGLVSFSTYTFSLMWQPAEHLHILAGVFDPEVLANDYSKTFFDKIGAYTVLEFDWKLAGDLGGVARFLGIYETKNATAIDNPRLSLDEVLGIGLETKSGNWMIGLNLEQYIWKPAHTKDERVGGKKLEYSTSTLGFQEPGLGSFARFAVLPANRNAIDMSASLGLAGRGIIPGRPLDRMGIGGYWLNASSDLEGLADVILDDEWGAELFYNYAITPSTQLTLDFQYIDSAVDTVDDAFVIGLRLFIQF